ALGSDLPGHDLEDRSQWQTETAGRPRNDLEGNRRTRAHLEDRGPVDGDLGRADAFWNVMKIDLIGHGSDAGRRHEWSQRVLDNLRADRTERAGQFPHPAVEGRPIDAAMRVFGAFKCPNRACWEGIWLRILLAAIRVNSRR